MTRRVLRLSFAAALAVSAASSLARAQEYSIDPAHSSASFKASHLGLSWIHGRFDELSGAFTINASDPSKTSFTLDINPGSVDTNNAKRDEHLKSPDFFNTKQFPKIAFKSTAIQPIQGGYKVTGDLTFHGVTRPTTFDLVGGKTAEFPKGVTRTGYSTDLVIKRSDFGMGKYGEMLGDDVRVSISFEGTRNPATQASKK